LLQRNTIAYFIPPLETRKKKFYNTETWMDNVITTAKLGVLARSGLGAAFEFRALGLRLSIWAAAMFLKHTRVQH
jgi:hypothetical protein